MNIVLKEITNKKREKNCNKKDLNNMKCLIYFTYLNGNRLYYLVNNLFNFSKLNNAGAKNSFRWWFIPMIESKSSAIKLM